MLLTLKYINFRSLLLALKATKTKQLLNHSINDIMLLLEEMVLEKVISFMVSFFLQHKMW